MLSKEQLKDLLKIEEKKQRMAELEIAMSSPDFWVDREKAEGLVGEFSDLKNFIEKFEAAQTPEQLQELERLAKFSGEYDANNALISLYAGAGGVDAQDWAQMLERMFSRYCEKRGFQVEELAVSPGGEAGIKSATLLVKGQYAFGYLKSEAGVHRLVRQSPFNAQNLRQTSFALVEVIPELEKNQEINIDTGDLRIDTYRSTGHGGQGVNTTDSAVRITHLPTGIVVTCQNERSQIQNREMAMKVLQAKLKLLQEEQNQQQTNELRGAHQQAAWGNQIRSYVLHPYKMVKDHRTDYESSNPEAVLGGDLDGFVGAYLDKQANKE